MDLHGLIKNHCECTCCDCLEDITITVGLVGFKSNNALLFLKCPAIIDKYTFFRLIPEDEKFTFHSSRMVFGDAFKSCEKKGRMLGKETSPEDHELILQVIPPG